ncbi:hypothetical protein ACFE04_010042 [Oxalis oulophora]
MEDYRSNLENKLYDPFIVGECAVRLSGFSNLDDLPRSSRREILSKETVLHATKAFDKNRPRFTHMPLRSSNLVDLTELSSSSSGMDTTDSSVKLMNTSSSARHHQYNLGRSIYLKRSRHYYAHQYSRKNSGNYSNASTSHGKGTPSRDEKLPFKLAGQQYNSDPRHYHPDSRGKTFFRPERIRSSSLVMDVISSDSLKLVCGMCQKHMRRKPCFLGDSLSSVENSVVAVLVCGHIYHAECLEQRTSHDDRHDPPCPLCLGLISEEDVALGQV